MQHFQWEHAFVAYSNDLFNGGEYTYVANRCSLFAADSLKIVLQGKRATRAAGSSSATLKRLIVRWEPSERWWVKIVGFFFVCLWGFFYNKYLITLKDIKYDCMCILTGRKWWCRERGLFRVWRGEQQRRRVWGECVINLSMGEYVCVCVRTWKCIFFFVFHWMLTVNSTV